MQAPKAPPTLAAQTREWQLAPPLKSCLLMASRTLLAIFIKQRKTNLFCAVPHPREKTQLQSSTPLKKGTSTPSANQVTGHWTILDLALEIVQHRIIRKVRRGRLLK